MSTGRASGADAAPTPTPPPAPAALSGLIGALADPDESVRRAAANSIVAVGASKPHPRYAIIEQIPKVVATPLQRHNPIHLSLYLCKLRALIRFRPHRVTPRPSSAACVTIRPARLINEKRF